MKKTILVLTCVAGLTASHAQFSVSANTVNEQMTASLKEVALLNTKNASSKKSSDRAATSIQLNDSITKWNFQTSTNGFTELNNRNYDLQYNANSRIIDQKRQYCSGSVCQDPTHITYTYNINDKYVSDLTQVWVGGAWVNSTQTIYTYNTANTLWLSSLSQNWVGGAWVNTSQTIMTYDANNNDISMLTQNWISGAWVNSRLTTKTFDSGNRETDNLTQDWVSGAWVNYFETIRTYDTIGNNTSYTDQTWNTTTNTWIGGSRSINTFDSLNRVISQLRPKWVGGAWVNKDKSDFIYKTGTTTSVAPTAQISLTWTAGAWDSTSVFLHTYNADSQKIASVYQIFLSGVRTDYFRYSYTYNAHGDMTLLLAKIETAGIWTDKQRRVNLFNTSNSQTEELNQTWNTTTNTWVNNDTKSWTYYANNDLKSLSNRTWNGTGVVSGDSTHYYINSPVGVKDADIWENKVTIYPNPTNTLLNIDLFDFTEGTSSIAITNSLGQVIFSENVSVPHTTFNVHHLNAGIYFVNITDSKGNRAVQKIIKE